MSENTLPKKPEKLDVLIEQKETRQNINAELGNLETKTAPQNPRIVSRAIVSVLTFLIADSFNLKEEEQQKLGYDLSKIIKPLESLPAEVILASVNKEMETGEYSKRLFNYIQKPEIPEEFYRNVKTALLEDWVAVISAAILSSYPTAKPMIQTTIIGQIYAVLLELGLTNDIQTSRKSVYLPNSIKYVLNQKKL